MKFRNFLTAIAVALIVSPTAPAIISSEISGSYFYFSLDGVDFDSTFASDVTSLKDQLSDSSGGYNLEATLRVTPVDSPTLPTGFSPSTFVDLTDLTLTCESRTAGCGAFSVSWRVYLDPITVDFNSIPASSSIIGSAPAGLSDLMAYAYIYVQGSSFESLGQFSSIAIPVDGSGNINTQLFSGVLNTTGATNISFFGGFSSSTGLLNGQSLKLPTSFTTVLGEDTRAEIPEPATVWMLLGGAAAIAWLRKRKQA